MWLPSHLRSAFEMTTSSSECLSLSKLMGISSASSGSDLTNSRSRADGLINTPPTIFFKVWWSWASLLIPRNASSALSPFAWGCCPRQPNLQCFALGSFATWLSSQLPSSQSLMYPARNRRWWVSGRKITTSPSLPQGPLALQQIPML